MSSAATLLLAVSVSAATAPDQQPPGDLPALTSVELIALWEAQRTEVVTASIRCLCFDGSVENAATTPERLAELIRSHDFTTDPQQLRPFLGQVLGTQTHQDPPWSDLEISIAGARRRQSDERVTFVRDGRYDFIMLPANHQATVYSPGQSRFGAYVLNDFRWTPPAPMTPDRIRVFDGPTGFPQVEFRPAGGRSVGDLVTTAIVDSATGIVTYKATHRSDGSPLKERYQLGIKTYPGNVSWPTAGIEAWFTNGTLRDLRVLLVQSARFNEPVPESKFVVSAPRGTTVIDHRASEVAGFVLETDVADLRAVIGPQRQPEPFPIDAGSDAAAKRILLWSNAILFVGAGFWIWRRRRRTSSGG